MMDIFDELVVTNYVEEYFNKNVINSYVDILRNWINFQVISLIVYVCVRMTNFVIVDTAYVWYVDRCCEHIYK